VIPLTSWNSETEGKEFFGFGGAAFSHFKYLCTC